jgi:O-succinylbenzoate synthase
MNEVGGTARSATGKCCGRSLAIAMLRCFSQINMGFHLQFRRYRLPLRGTVRTAHEVWTEREGLILRIEDHRGSHGFGEVAPIPAFGTETIEMAETVIRRLGEWPTQEQLDTVPSELGCVRNAIGSALRDVGPVVSDAPRSNAPQTGGVEAARPITTTSSYRAVAALLPSGRAAVAELQTRAEAGFRTFKWKVGIEDMADELGLLDDLCAGLPTGARLRLDANGAWDRRRAERWLERCAERPIEFVEQPCFAAKANGETAWRRAEDSLLGLAQDYPTPIALDESLVAAADVERWLGVGWPGWFIVKPSLLGDPHGVLSRLAAAHATVVFSSALETAIGARAALRCAFSWAAEPKALGFGVWPLFQDPRFDGPAAAPFIRAEDVTRIDPEATWNALS